MDCELPISGANTAAAVVVALALVAMGVVLVISSRRRCLASTGTMVAAVGLVVALVPWSSAEAAEDCSGSNAAVPATASSSTSSPVTNPSSAETTSTTEAPGDEDESTGTTATSTTTSTSTTTTTTSTTTTTTTTTSTTEQPQPTLGFTFGCDPLRCSVVLEGNNLEPGAWVRLADTRTGFSYEGTVNGAGTVWMMLLVEPCVESGFVATTNAYGVPVEVSDTLTC